MCFDAHSAAVDTTRLHTRSAGDRHCLLSLTCMMHRRTPAVLPVCMMLPQEGPSVKHLLPSGHPVLQGKRGPMRGSAPAVFCGGGFSLCSLSGIARIILLVVLLDKPANRPFAECSHRALSRQCVRAFGETELQTIHSFMLGGFSISAVSSKTCCMCRHYVIFFSKEEI